MANPTIDLATEWANHTVVHPIGLTALCVAALAMVTLPRRLSLVPLLLFAVTVPSAQRFILLSLDLSFIRILIFVALARALLRGELGNFRLNAADRLLLAWAIWGVFAYTMLDGSFAAFVTRTGYMVEVAGAYFLGRMYFQRPEDAAAAMVALGVVALPMMGLFVVEWTTGRNLLSVFGGVPEMTLIREGRIRCQGPFSHPIMAGVFWASLLPWFVLLRTQRAVPPWATLLFIGASLVIVMTTASSTPIIAVIAGALGLLAFPFRKLMPLARWGFFGALVALHLVMNTPVWHLVARIDVVGGSTGWHRYHLIDQAIRRVDEWWLFGTSATAHWGYGLGDVTNQFVLEAVRGGLLGLLLFCGVLVATFAIVGRAIARAGSVRAAFGWWAIGVALAVHTLNFIAVSYFGQLTSLFFLLLGATVALATSSSPVPHRVAQPELASMPSFRVLQ